MSEISTTLSEEDLLSAHEWVVVSALGLSQDDLLSLPSSEVFTSALSPPCSGVDSDFLLPLESDLDVDETQPAPDRRELWPLQFFLEEVLDLDMMQGSVPAGIAHQIEIDVLRTRSLSMRESDRVTLRRVLHAYATLDPVVGYCQGMSDIAAVFVLQGLDESDSLRGLCSISRSCCPDYFCPSLAGFLRDMVVLEVLASEILPSASVQMLESLDVPLTLLAADHFLTLASHTWPLEAVKRLWDIFLVEGSCAVFASFLVLLQLYLPNTHHSEKFMDGPEKVKAFTRAVAKGVVEELDIILEQTRQFLLDLPMSRIERLRTNAEVSS